MNRLPGTSLAPASRPRRTVPGIVIEYHGTIVLLRPLDLVTEERLRSIVDPQESRWFGGALACEPRYVEGLLAGFFEEFGGEQ